MVMLQRNGFCLIELEYIGCYSVSDLTEQLTPNYIRNQVHLLQKRQSRSHALLIISVAGVKVTCKSTQKVLVKNSLFQINYCSYLREDGLFCFLSRESSRFDEVHQYCHVFTNSSDTNQQVDELNENIRNALSAAHAAKTTIPQKKPDQPSPLTPNQPVPSLTRSQSASVSQLNTENSGNQSTNKTKSRQLRHTQSLNITPTSATCNSTSNADDTSNSSRQNISPSTAGFTESLDEGALRRLIRSKTQKKLGSQPQPISLAGSLDERTLRQALRPSTLNIIDEQPISNLQGSGGEDRLQDSMTNQLKSCDETKAGNLSARQNRRRLAKTSSGCAGMKSRYLSDLNLNSSCPVIPSSETKPTAREQFSLVEKLAELGININTPVTDPHKTQSTSHPSPREHKSPVWSDAGFREQADFSAESSPSQQSLSSCESKPHPSPPSAFCDAQPAVNEPESFSHVILDYSEVNRKVAGDPSEMSFYSESNYYRTNSYTRRSVISSPNLSRSEKIRHSVISSTSSGISVNSCNSFENELMTRPLPTTPSSVAPSINRSVTPQRYQNDSPFAQRPAQPHDLSSSNDDYAMSRPPSAEDILRQVPWFQPHMNREQVLDYLSGEELGSFIIRESATHDKCFALSVKVPKFNNATGVAHYIIHRTEENGFRIKGLDKEWSNLTALVTHHTIMPELLPCTLTVPRPVMARRHGSTASRSSSSSRASTNSDSERIANNNNNQQERLKLNITQAL